MEGMSKEKRYAVSAMFRTLQGEGLRAGTPAVFCRLSGCNAWNGTPADRSKGKGECARWCDADFRPREHLTAEEIVARLNTLWPAVEKEGTPFETRLGTFESRWVVVTGGEPLLQLDRHLTTAMRNAGWMIAVETNGSVLPKELVASEVDHFCVSPKRGLATIDPGVFCASESTHQTRELKVVCAGDDWLDSEVFLLGKEFAEQGFRLYVQPRDPINPQVVEASHLIALRHNVVKPTHAEQYKRALEWCIAFVQKCPAWTLSAQLHKYLGLE